MNVSNAKVEASPLGASTWKSNNKKDESTIIIQQKFVITVGDKTSANKLVNKGSQQAFYINGIEAPTLLLKRNVFYEFQNMSDEPLYFKTDLEGGYKENSDGTSEEAPDSLSFNASGGFKGLAKGRIFVRIPDHFPVYFYYQSGKHKFMGSIVQLA